MADTVERITTVQVYRGYTTIILTLDEVDGGYEVAGASFYRTAHGARVGNVRERRFRTLAAARRYANGWFFSLRRSGWERVPEKR